MERIVGANLVGDIRERGSLAELGLIGHGTRVDAAIEAEMALPLLQAIKHAKCRENHEHEAKRSQNRHRQVKPAVGRL